jgi:hypothetical protein
MTSNAAPDSLIRLVRQTPIQCDITAFLIEREAGGCSPRTLEYYSCVAATSPVAQG